MPLRLTMACGPYDRTEALRTGEIAPAGIELDYRAIIEPWDIFGRMVHRREFDVAEMSAAFLLARKAQGATVEELPLVAIPVFPSRRFRHGCVFINTDTGIHEPKDLAGKRIGVTQFRTTATVWIRGILENDYGVDLSDVEWFGGRAHGVDERATTSLRARADLPIDMYRPTASTTIPDDTTLSDMLASGEVDAVISSRVPASLHTHTHVRRLFEDYPQEERDYYRRTGIYPVMHTLVMDAGVYARHPWAAESLYDAFVQAKGHAVARLHRSGAAKTMLPWQLEAVEEVDEIFGADFWAHGLERNRETLRTLMTYLVQQGFAAEPVDLDAVFVPIVETGY